MTDLILPDRLSSGMTAREATRLASAWWNNRGRHLVRREFNLEHGSCVIPSGILLGIEFDRLTREEQLRVVKTWHEFKIVKNDAPDRRDAEIADAERRLRLDARNS